MDREIICPQNTQKSAEGKRIFVSDSASLCVVCGPESFASEDVVTISNVKGGLDAMEIARFMPRITHIDCMVSVPAWKGGWTFQETNRRLCEHYNQLCKTARIA